MTTFSVGYMVGSLAKGSINRKLARALTRLAPEGLQLREVPIGDLPLYSYDYDAAYPPQGQALKDAIASVDAILFVTPEYNRSIPGALKNAIDWGRRPTAPAKHHGLLQLAVDERDRSVHPVHPRAHHARGRGHGRGNARVPGDLHEGVPRLHLSRLHGDPAKRGVGDPDR